jgi:hypothetical protein
MKTLITAIFTVSLLASLSVQAGEALAVENITAVMVKENAVEVNKKLSSQLYRDIQVSLWAMKVPSEVEVKQLLAKTNLHPKTNSGE